MVIRNVYYGTLKYHPRARGEKDGTEPSSVRLHSGLCTRFHTALQIQPPLLGFQNYLCLAAVGDGICSEYMLFNYPNVIGQGSREVGFVRERKCMSCLECETRGVSTPAL